MINNKTLIRLKTVILLLTFCNTYLLSQAVVERSKDKIVISGITYYLHVVKKGETVYSISRAYGLTSEELTKENPGTVNGLKDGQSLRIPVSLVSNSQLPAGQPLQRTVRDESRFIYHKLQEGETIYFLSKTYNITESEIIQSNPGIDINKLPLGYEIAIPKKDLNNSVSLPKGVAQQAYYHKVIRGETMSSISRQYGLTVRELRKANGENRFPQVGDYLLIPGMKPPQVLPVQEIAADTFPVAKEEKPVFQEKQAGNTSFKTLSGSLNVAVLLPFYLPENSKRSDIDSSKTVKGKKVYSFVTRQDDWIYPRSLGFLEMYQGILLAADTLRTLGLNININVFDIKSDTAEVTNLIRSGKLDRMDLIIGPVHSKNLTIVASYARNLGIPVVSPVDLSSNLAIRNNPNLFLAGSSLEIAQKAIAKKVSEYADRNIVVIHSDTDAERQEYEKLHSLIYNDLATRESLEKIRLKDMVFYSRSVFGTDSAFRLTRTLADRESNVVIIASEDPPVMSESVTDVHAFARKYEMNVFGYPAMRYLDNFDHKVFFDLGLRIFSPYWIDYRQQDVKRFNYKFREKFITEPSETSYAWQGYDIAYYFLSGLSIYGKAFIEHPEMHNPDLLHTEFDFRHDSVNDGFENQKLYLIKYSNTYELELSENY